jgi:acetyltransferase EpsM
VTTPTPLLVYGAGGHALVVADILSLNGTYEIVGFIDDVSPTRRAQRLGPAPILGGAAEMDGLRKRGVRHAIVAIGDCAARQRIAERLAKNGFEMVTAIHPRATVARDAAIGPGTVVCANAAIMSGTNVGANAIINTSASVDHQCEVGDGVHVGPGVRLGGRVRIGSGAWIGIGATVIDRASVGSCAIVGAGALVLRDVSPFSIAYGVPARHVRDVDR